RARLVGSVSRQQLLSLYPEFPAEQHAPILSEDEWEPAPVDDAEPSRGDQSRGGEASETTRRNAAGGGSTAVASAQATYDSTLQALAAVPHLLGEGEGIGSNSWVVSGDHTESGMPL